MGLFDRDYDRDFERGTYRQRYGADYQGGPRSERTYRPADSYRTSSRMYDRGYAGYDDEYGANRKSRYETDFGDPFGDRQEQTPMRMVHRGYDRGWWGFGGGGRDREGYDREYRGGGRSGWRNDARFQGYGQDYSSNPMGYEPGPRGRRRWGNDYDRGMF
jgi:hypothetical protein